MVKKKPVTTPAGEVSHEKGLTRMGSILHTVTAGSSPLRSGTALNNCLESGVKAILPGRQTDRQLHDTMVKFRQAFVRQLAEEATRGVTSDRGQV